jgi:hypothetical protein
VHAEASATLVQDSMKFGETVAENLIYTNSEDFPALEVDLLENNL